jgi:hypothetical protein
VNISDRLTQLARFYHREARKCTRGKAYLAATVLQVAALEAGLQAMCSLYPRDVKKTTVFANRRFRGRRSKHLEFSLSQLINVADELGWFPPKRTTFAGKRASLAGFSHEIRKVRNLVHPGAWARQRSAPLKFTKRVYEVVFEVFDVANSWLLHRVETCLLKAMGRKNRNP